ncbi:MAG: hypothetical protein ACKO6N_14770 [Myxococcota bacterium]
MKHRMLPLLLMTMSSLLACEAPVTPAVSITAPAEGATLKSNEVVQFIFDVDDFELDPAAVGESPEAGHGHIHIFLDDLTQPIQTTPASAIDIDLSSLVLTPGFHVFRAALFNNDHTPIEEAISDSVEVNIEAP